MVNEAMNSGCAVVADHMIGAAPLADPSGENGWMYRDGEEQELFRTVERLLRDPGECRRLGENAQQTIAGEWNARTAAERLIELCRKNEVLARNVRRTGNAGCRPGCDAGHHNICPGDSTIME